MAGGWRFRSEAPPFSGPATNFTQATKTFASGTTIVLVSAAALVGSQRPAVYRLALIAAGATTFQFQDTSAGILSAQYNLAAAGSQFIIGDGAIQGDPLWQPSAPGLGLQIVIGAAAIVGDIWIGFGV